MVQTLTKKGGTTEIIAEAMRAEGERRASSEVSYKGFLKKILKSVLSNKKMTAVRALRVVRFLKLEDPENDLGISVRDLKSKDIPRVAEIYRKVAVDPKDLCSFSENGGIFRPLDEKDLKKAHKYEGHHPQYVMEHEGEIIAFFDFLLPPDSSTKESDYEGTVFDPEYSEHLGSEHQQFIHQNRKKIVWFHDFVVDPDCKVVGAGYAFIRHICRKIYE
jgi:hypothetical protein